MIGLGFHFDIGRYHATPWAANVNEARVEWPPSPWRILRALYSVGRTNVTLHGGRDDLDGAIAVLARAGGPSYVVPASSAAHTRHYVPEASWSGYAQGDTALVLDGFLALDPESRLEAWWDVDLEQPQQSALAQAAAALGYLGRSESLCTAELLAGPAPEAFDAVPDEATDNPVWLRIVESDDPLSALSVSVTDLRHERRLVPPETKEVPYRVGSEPPRAPAPTDKGPRPTLAVFRIRGGDRPAMYEAVTAAAHLRQALQSQFGKRTDGASSPVFSGRDGDAPRASQHRHAHYLALPDKHGRRVDRLAVWAPEGFGVHEVESLARLRRILAREGEPSRTALTALGTPDTIRMDELLGPATAWRSSTPFALPRHPKRRSGGVKDGAEDQIRRELDHRGFPAPEEIVLFRGPWAKYRRVRPGQSRLQSPPAVGAVIRFSEPVGGPIALGALSHFGLGLFRPDRT